MRKLAILLLVNCVSILDGQAPPQLPAPPAAEAAQTEPQLSPQAAFDQATQPLDVIRRSTQNWSEVELDALKAARARAGVECSARNPDSFSGNDLLALAHLCAFAQQWRPVLQAAANYLAAVQGPALPTDLKGLTDMATAFDYKVQASLNLEDLDGALVTGQTMLRTVPYDEFTSEATNSTARYDHFIHSNQALSLLVQRQPLLLNLIKSIGVNAGSAAGTAPGTGGSVPSTATDSHPPLPLYVLYSDAIALPWMQQFVNQPAAADESYAELEAALPGNLSSEDGMYIAEKRRQYLLLGRHLPHVTPMGWLFSRMATPPEDFNTRFENGTIYLLFPDWCNQCIAMAFNSTPRAKDLYENFRVRFYPLIAQANPPEKRTAAGLRQVPPSASRAGKAGEPVSAPGERMHIDQQVTIASTPYARLAGTPTIVVPNETLDAFAAADFPLLIAVDGEGIVRAIQLAPDDALAPGSDVDQLAQHLISTWPSK